MRVLLLLLVTLVCGGALCHAHSRSLSGEWGVKVAEGVDPEFLDRMGFTVVKPIGTLKDSYLVRPKDVTAQHSALHAALQGHPHVVFSEMQHKKKMYTKTNVAFPDPLFPNQWHLVNTGQQGGIAGEDINVTGAWDLGYTGRGVRIAFVDDGYQYIHPDLAVGYVASSSYNFNDDTPDPAPGPYDFHGTSAAGVALASNNSLCGVGSAYGAEGSGLRLLGDWFTDSATAYALSYEYQANHIYSNSWGPSDNGATHEGPGKFATAAIADAIAKGRGGLGSVYVWAAGNGLQNNDNCNYDGFANSRYIIAVGAIGNDGVQSYYSEPCAAMLVTAPSSSRAAGITTTDILGTSGYNTTDCTTSFGGTSSSCPLVAGVIALMLEANPKLTWRDVQYVLLQTADKNDANDTDWTENGAGHHVNHKYGFGRVNAFHAVQAALAHKTVKEAKTVSLENINVNQTIPDGGNGSAIGLVAVSEGLVLEHVEVSVNISNLATVGDLKIVLTSPAGTKSILADQHGIISYFVYAKLPYDTTLPQGTEFALARARFGPYISGPINGTLAIPQPSPYACDGVDNITNCADLQGKIALVDRLVNCSFTTQVYNAQQCGSIGVVVVNNVAGAPEIMGGTNSNITIPSVMIALEDGAVLQQLVNGPDPVFLSVFQVPNRANLTYDGWSFSTVRNWGENSDGNWTLEVIDTLVGNQGDLVSWDLRIYGYSPKSSTSDDGLAPWAIGVIVGGAVALVAVVAGLLYYRSKRTGYDAV